MNAKEIKKVFSQAGIKIPEYFKTVVETAYYDSEEDWCCGLTAKYTNQGKVVVQEYCLRGRGGDKSVWLVNQNGSFEEIDKTDKGD